MKKPFYYALGAALYIVMIVLLVNGVGTLFMPAEDNLMMPMTMLGLFVLSAAVMGFCFLSEPLSLLTTGRKQEAIVYFGQIVGCFAIFVLIFAVLILVFSK